MAPSTSSIAPTAASVPAAKTLEEKEKKFTLPKTNSEARKTGRKLVRPRILKPEDSQADIETSEVEGSDNNTKPLSHDSVETQGTLMLQAPAPVRKRPSNPSLELPDSLVPGETSSEATEPTLKKSKNSETLPDSGEGQPSESGEAQAAVNSENLGVVPATDESMEDVTDLPSESKESADADKDEIESNEKQEQSTIDAKRQEEFQGDIAAEESLNKVNEGVDPLSTPTEQEIQQPATESGSELEEGELVTDIPDPESGSVPNVMGSPEPGELQPENPTTSEEPMDVAAAEVGELDDDKNEDGNMAEDIAESSEKSNDNNERPAVEPDEVSEASAATPPETTTSTSTTVEVRGTRQGGTTLAAAADMEGRQQQAAAASRSSTTINLLERAKERASIRQAAMSPSLANRGRGRSVRGRGGRSARGQGQGKQG